jgi:hypothetical protein
MSLFSQAAGISGDETESTHCISQNGLKSAMKEFSVVVLSLAVLASSGAFAQVKTRAEVYYELIEAQPNDPNNVTETSYPDVSPIFTEQVTRMKQAHLAQPNATTARRPMSCRRRQTGRQEPGRCRMSSPVLAMSGRADS